MISAWAVGVVTADRSVPSFADDLIAQNQNRADRHLAVLSGALRQDQCAFHEIDIAGRGHGGRATCGARRP